ncbi:MAG TPA: outer membrane protein assembly factor BamA [bacterium]|nr:outer membrane protein assembly factor BamA [bacterium]
MCLPRRLAAIGLAFLFFPVTSAVARTASPAVIQSIEIENQGLAQEIPGVLPVKQGDLYDPAKVEQTVSYLKKWGRFSEVSVDADPVPGGVVLRIHVKDGVIISGINIYGTYPYLSTRIRRMITVHSGDVYDEALALAQTDKIEAFYGRQGYEVTEVTLKPKFNEKKNTVDLNYDIKRGSRYRIGKITVNGNTVFPQGYFISQIDPLILYKPTRMRKSIEKIKKGYQKKGYLGARVRLSDLGKNEEKGTVNPVIEVHEGRHVDVIFRGNRRINEHSLKKVMPMFTDGGSSRYEIDASVKAITEAYHRKGFQEVTVADEQKDLTPDGSRIAVTFRIHEGPQTRVKEISIAGNEEVSDRKIKKGLITRENTITQPGYYQPRTVEQDFSRLPALMGARGALDAKAVDHDVRLNDFHDKAHVTFMVEEGPIVRLDEVRFQGNHNLEDRLLNKRLKLHAGDAVSPPQIDADKEALTVFYANRGFPYATIAADLQRNGDRAVLTYKIEEGPETKIGEVLVVGNERTLKKAVLRAMRIRPGDRFSYARILDSESQLRRSGSFRSVNIQTIGLTEREPVVHLVVKLEEYRKLVADIGATYDTDNSFTGELSLSQVNLGGTIRRANIRILAGRDIQRGELLFKDPFFIGYPFEATMNVFVERNLKPGFHTKEGGGSLGFLREFSPRATFLGRYELVRTFFSDVIDPTGIPEEDHTTSKFSFSYNYDHRDSFGDPTRGYLLFSGLDISNSLIASTVNFIQPKGLAAYFFPLGNRTTLMAFAHMEGIKVFGSDTLARNDKLFLGGDYSVRGFDQDSVGPVGSDGRPAGGQLLIAATFELQTRLFNNFKLAFFQDNGSITDNFSQVSPNSFRHSAGVGLRYVTPVGPLRLDYGFKLDKKAGESVGRLHFAFGYSF